MLNGDERSSLLRAQKNVSRDRFRQTSPSVQKPWNNETLGLKLLRDIQQNNIQHNDTQHKNINAALSIMTLETVMLGIVYSQCRLVMRHLCWVSQINPICLL